MKNAVLAALAVTLSTAFPLAAAPTIAASGIKNNASYVNPAFPNGSIAQGSLFAIFGSGLGPDQIQYASNFPIPTNLSGTTVNVTVNGTTLPCPIIFTLASQVAAILPSTTPLGTGTVVVSYNGTAGSAAPITVVAHSLGLFSVNQQGTGPGIVQDGSGKQNGTSNAFAPGQTVVFWGTGLGPISGSDAAQPTQTNMQGAGITVTATVGGKPATVVYAGRSLDAADDQINVQLPAGVTGCYIPVYFTVAGSSGPTVTSNIVSISIAASGTTCTDASAPQGLLNGTGYKAGSLGLSRFVTNLSFGGQTVASTTDGGSGSFFSYTPAYLTSAGNFAYYDVTVGTCTVTQLITATGGTTNLPTGLDAGPVINITGPNGVKQMTKTGTMPGIYSASLGTSTSIPGVPSTPLYLDPGTYTLDNGSGGADVGPFKLTITVPPTFNWTNQTITTVDRTQPLTITWTGGDPNSLVFVGGSSMVSNSVFASFVCYGKDSDLSLTVPPAILSLLPASGTTSGVATGGLEVYTYNTATGTAPGLDLLTASDSSGFVKNGVTYK
jgi:uncharacterized protein (TIGR03437 family)